MQRLLRLPASTPSGPHNSHAAMMKLRTLRVFFLLFLLPLAAAHAQWTPTNLMSGNINTVFANGGDLLAGMNGGSSVLITHDDGVSWGSASTGMVPGSDVRAFAASTSYVFVGTTNGVYRSVNNGTYSWTKVLDNVSCFSLLVTGPNLFAGTLGGGVFLSTDDGANWTPANTGMAAYPYVYALAANGAYVFAGKYGQPGVNADGVYRSNDNGATWTQVANGLTNTNVFSLAVEGGYLFAGTNGGVFRSSDDGANWTFLAGGVVHALKVVCGVDLYAGRLSSGGVSHTIDNGTTWTAFSSGLPNTGGLTVTSLALSSTYLFAGTLGGGVSRAPVDCSTTLGSICGMKFNDANGNGEQDEGELGLAGWGINLTGATTSSAATDIQGNYCFSDLPMGTYTVSEVNQTGWQQTVPASPDAYTVTLAAGQDVGNLIFGNTKDLCLNGTKSWSALGTGITNGTNGEVWALAVIGTDLYAGGWFTTAGGNTVNHIAKWNGASWSALVSSNGEIGINGGVFALAVIGTDLYAGGWFTAAGGSPAMNIAKWDGTNWSALGNGLPGSGAVEALAVIGTDLYAGGAFTTALGGPGDLIAKWDTATSTWSALGNSGGMNDRVNSLVVDGTDLYAGGQFTTAGGVPANFVARWNGSNWSSLGTGTDLGVGGSLVVVGTTLYAGGVFTMAGGIPTDRIAQWDITNSVWSALGTNGGMNNEVEGFAVIGTDLYASGGFTTAGGASANRVARWDGTTWSPLGSGMNDGVWRLAVIGQDLYAGGIFTTAGGVSANYIAKYSCSVPNVSNTGSICGLKFNDLNGNGVQEAGEPGLPGWRLNLDVATIPAATTDSLGSYCFTNLPEGTYTVTETNQVGWVQTFPAAPGTHTVVLAAGQDLTDIDFGNIRTPECIPPPQGMRGWWPGDDNAHDLSGFGNNGTLQGGATYGGGKVANAFTLMNAADYVSIPDAAALNFGISDFSIDAWVKTTDGSNALNIVDKQAGTLSNPVGYSLYLLGGRLTFLMGDGQPTVSFGTSAPVFSDGNWHFVAVTVDRDAITGGKMYVDGILIRTFDPTSRSGSITNPASLYIGQWHLYPPISFNGQIDEVELFSRVLRDTEIDSLFAADSTGKCRSVGLEEGGTCDETTPELSVNTGFDHPTSSAYPVGGNDAFWTITLDADTSRTVPRPAEVIATVTNIWPPAQNNSQWIGPSQVLPNNSALGFEQNDVGLGDYRYALALCIVGETAEQLTFNLSLLADNYASVWLRLPDGTTRLSVGTTPSNGFSSLTSIATTLIAANLGVSFVPGTYLLEVDVHNDGISPDFTGMNLTGAITGANLYLQKHECCNSSGKLLGTKFNDGNGNGLQDSEPGLQGVVIELLQNGAIVDTTTTDGAGEYFFDVPPGTYTVHEVVPMGYTQTSPTAGTYTVTVGPGGIVPNLDFGNQAIPCIGATSQFLCKPTGGRYIQLTLTYHGTMPVSHITVTSLTPGVSFTVTNTPTYPVNQGDTVVLNIDFTGLAAGAAAQMLINMDGMANEFGVSESCCDGTLAVVRPGGPGTLLGLYCGPIIINGGVVVIGNPHVLVDGWVIRMEDQEGRSSTTETDSTGYFVQEGLPVGTYSVSVDLRLGWKVAEPDSGFFTLAFKEGDPGASLRFVISPLATVGSPIASDFNGDGGVGFGDFFLFADAFGGTDARFDLDKNGTVDFGDFFIFADSFGGQERAKLMALAQQYIGLPASPRLEQNFPNPFNSSTTIKYYIIEPGRVHLDVFDLSGQKIKSIVDEYQEPGSYKTTWDGTNEQRQPVSTGIYLTKLEAGGFTEMKKMLLMK